MADVTVVAKISLWVCGALLYLGMVGLISHRKVSTRIGLPLLAAGAGVFLVGSYYLLGPEAFVPLLLIVVIILVLRVHSFSGVSQKSNERPTYCVSCV